MKKMNLASIVAKSALFSGLVLSACGQTQTLNFAAKAGEQTFECGQDLTDIGLSSSVVSPRDLRVFIHDIELDGLPLAIEDGPFAKDGVVLLDFADDQNGCTSTPATNTSIEVSSGSATGELTFKVGIPFELNHQDVAAADAPFNDETMFWNWQAGYKFVRFDAATAGIPDYKFHLGSTGCEADEDGTVTGCATENVQTFTADIDFNNSLVVFDLEALFGNSDLEVDNGGVPGCLSAPTDPECPGILTRIDQLVRFE